VLVLPTEAPDRCLPGRLENRRVEGLPADAVALRVAVRRPALLLHQVEQRLVGKGFHKPVAHQIQGHACGSYVFRVRHSLLQLNIRELRVGADGPIVDQGAPGDNRLAVVDGNAWILELPVRASMSDPKFTDLT